ncbi:MAG TPA: hypothetical protein VK108_06035 [Pseudogracilibacillus sp.]|nr:hypothetical protein [Pseudogracilibacillus sp.]
MSLPEKIMKEIELLDEMDRTILLEKIKEKYLSQNIATTITEKESPIYTDKDS